MIDAPIQIIDGLPFVAVTVYANGQFTQLDRILLDTGSGGTVLKTDRLLELGVVPTPTDRLRFLRGVGGNEVVIEKSVERLQVGALVVTPFFVQMGAVDYGIPMNGILGVDFLLRTYAGSH